MLSRNVRPQLMVASVAWADETVVGDSEGTHATVEIARRYTSKVLVRPWPGYVAQKNRAAGLHQKSFDFSSPVETTPTPSPTDTPVAAHEDDLGAALAGPSVSQTVFALDPDTFHTSL